MRDHDAGINNGRVVEPETMGDEVANVGITVGCIFAITRDDVNQPPVSSTFGYYLGGQDGPTLSAGVRITGIWRICQ